MESTPAVEGYQIAAVARLTGLSADTIRMWERRYGLIHPRRDAAGIRRYSDAEIARLEQARRATENGHSIRIVAALSDEEIGALLERTRPSADPPITGTVATAILGAVLDLDASRARRTLRSASLLLDPKELVLDVFVPLMDEVGRLWSAGKIAVWQEHLLSEIVGSAAGTVGRTVNGTRTDGFVFATPPGELHGFGIAFAAMLASAGGFSANSLGPNLPAGEVVRSARDLRARWVVVGAARSPETASSCGAFFEELERALPQRVELWIGGPVDRHKVHAPRAKWVPTLAEFSELLGGLR